MTPNPGSDEAVAQGCTCPVIDNARGSGCGRTNPDGSPMFWMSGACPLHGYEAIEMWDKVSKELRDSRSAEAE